jgi:hypothetical protein
MEVNTQKRSESPAVGGEEVEFCGGAVAIRVRRASHLHRVGHFERLLRTELWGSLCTPQLWGTADSSQLGLWRQENILVQDRFLVTN